MTPADGLPVAAPDPAERERVCDEFPPLSCDKCGRSYEDWVTDDDLWSLVVPESGMWCPECFTRRAYVEHGLDEWRIEVYRGGPYRDALLAERQQDKERIERLETKVRGVESFRAEYDHSQDECCGECVVERSVVVADLDAALAVEEDAASE